MGKQQREKATVYDGDIVDIDVMPERKTGLGKKAKWGKTSEIQKKVNAAYRKRYFRRLMEKNFRFGAQTLTLTFSKDHEPLNRDDCKAKLNLWIRRIRRLYQKAKLILKYLAVPAQGADTGRWHIHVVISGGIEKSQLLAKWRSAHGMWADDLEYSEFGYGSLAEYLDQNVSEDIEEYNHAYIRSRNLEEVEAERDDSKLKKQFDRVFTKEFCERLYRHDLTRAELHNAFPGYKVIDGWSCTYNTYNHGYIIHMRLLKWGTSLPEWCTTKSKEDAAVIEHMEYWWKRTHGITE